MSLEPIEPPETELTGEEIIEDAASRLVEALVMLFDCYLRISELQRQNHRRVTAFGLRYNHGHGNGGHRQSRSRTAERAFCG